MAIEALRKAPDTSSPALKAAITQTKDVPGIAGAVTLDDKRNAVNPAVVLKVGDGKSDYVTTVNP